MWHAQGDARPARTRGAIRALSLLPDHPSRTIAGNPSRASTDPSDDALQLTSTNTYTATFSFAYSGLPFYRLLWRHAGIVDLLPRRHIRVMRRSPASIAIQHGYLQHRDSVGRHRQPSLSLIACLSVVFVSLWAFSPVRPIALASGLCGFI